ncbi:nucleotide exchange factor [Candidatus Vidania fulgoroideae]|nr:nucleotide exchange factor [Candidatus Vidania fulgoroideae]
MTKKKIKENYKNKYIALMAEIENTKKRFLRELKKERKLFNEDFIKKTLPILDSLNLILKSSKDIETKNSIRSTIRLFSNIFKCNGVKEICPKKFSNFDPNLHQAIVRVNAFKKHNLIFNVFQRGYSIFNKIIRPALVSIT